MTLAIGDLQGCLEPLRHLLRSIEPSRQEPLWFCGDLVNRGPQSLETLRFIHGLGDRAVTVLGNHDLHLLALAAGARTPKRGDTLDPILSAPDSRALIHWLRHQPLAVLRGDFLMVHAGVWPEWDTRDVLALAHEVETVLRGPWWGDFLQVMYGNDPDRWDPSLGGDQRLRVIVNILTRIRYLRSDGHMDMAAKCAPTEAHTKGLTPWYELPRRTAQRTLVFGHWSTLGLQNRPGLIALDTGCVWGGCLTAMRLESRRIWQHHCPQFQSPDGE